MLASKGLHLSGMTLAVTTGTFTATAALAVSSPVPTATTSPAQVASQEIASTVMHTDLKVAVQATKVDESNARVDVSASRYFDGKWQPWWIKKVPGTWSWAAVTGPWGACTLDVTIHPRANGRIYVGLRESTNYISCAKALETTVTP